MTEPYELTVAQAAREIRERRISAVELAESLLSRADAVEPHLRIWVTLDHERFLGAAQESDRTLHERGPQGALHGVPVGVKDIYYTEGQ